MTSQDETGQQKETKLRRRKVLALFLFLLLAFICSIIGLLPQWFASAKSLTLLDVTLHSSGEADYSADPRPERVPAISLAILKDIILDNEPYATDWAGRLATVTAVLGSPIPTMTPAFTPGPAPVRTVLVPTENISQSPDSTATQLADPAPSVSSTPMAAPTPTVITVASLTPEPTGTRNAALLTRTPTPTSRIRGTPTRTPAATQTTTCTPTNTPTVFTGPAVTSTPTLTSTSILTATPILTPTPTLSPTSTPAGTPTPTSTPTPTATYTPTNAPTPTVTFTPTNTFTPTSTPAASPTPGCSVPGIDGSLPDGFVQDVDPGDGTTGFSITRDYVIIYFNQPMRKDGGGGSVEKPEHYHIYNTATGKDINASNILGRTYNPMDYSLTISFDTTDSNWQRGTLFNIIVDGSVQNSCRDKQGGQVYTAFTTEP